MCARISNDFRGFRFLDTLTVNGSDMVSKEERKKDGWIGRLHCMDWIGLDGTGLDRIGLENPVRRVGGKKLAFLGVRNPFSWKVFCTVTVLYRMSSCR